MINFMEELWGSIFTPGPTPTLLIATNIAFAALQALLLALLVATYSVHFIILSFLCGGLWLSINWFSKEVQAFQASEEYRKKTTRSADGESKSQGSSSKGEKDSGMNSADEASSEDDELASSLGPPGVDPQTGARTTASVSTASGSTRVENTVAAAWKLGATASLAPDDALRQRRSLAESTGDLSTDSEWEKVEDD